MRTPSSKEKESSRKISNKTETELCIMMKIYLLPTKFIYLFMKIYYNNFISLIIVIQSHLKPQSYQIVMNPNRISRHTFNLSIEIHSSMEIYLV